MSDKITLKVYSVDGKTYIDDVDFVYVDVPDYGVRGLTQDIPLLVLFYLLAHFIMLKIIKKLT